MSRLPAACLGVALLACGAGAVVAQAPPHQMLEAILLYAGRGEFEKVEKGLVFIQPVLDEFREHFAADLGAEIRQVAARRDREATQAAILKLAFYDMRHNLELLSGREGVRRSGLVYVRLAYLDFLMLAPRVDHPRGGSPGATGRRFRKIYALVEKSKPGDRDAIAAAIVEQIEAIRRECLTAFPEWSAS